MLYKDDVVKMMSDYINKMNLEILRGMGTPDEDAANAIEQMQTELNRVNGLLYDLLKENGIIP
jgi:hypothetical protein